MRKNKRLLIVANWKMYLNTSQASLLLHRLQERIKIHRDVEVVLAPSMLVLQPLSMQLDRRKFRLASQDAYSVDEGAFTGEVSFAMLQDLVHYGVIGHSARRVYFHENLDSIRDKVAAAVRSGIMPILCVGETKHERVAKETHRVLHDQISTALSNLTSNEVGGMVIAYEPIWAISTFEGELALPDVVAKDMKFVRDQVTELYGPKAGKRVRILYGGSVDDHDARAYLEIPDCDGLLVGAASLNYHKFAGVVDTAFKLQQENSETVAKQ